MSRIDKIIETELESTLDEIDIQTKERLFKNIKTSIDFKEHKQPISITIRVLRWTAILLLPLVSSIVTYYIVSSNINKESAPVTFSTGYGERANITLPDGSHVWLNSGTSVTLNSSFNKRERTLKLNGEAYFEVAEDARKPFIVQANDITVEALGTSFNVTAYKDDSFVSSVLIDGSIRVSADGQERILKENHRATYYKEGRKLATDAVLASDYILWKEGYLYFESSSFEDIAKQLSRMFNVKIEFTSDNLRSIRFTGTLGNSSIKNVLDILSLTSPMYYEMNGTTVELFYSEN